MFLAQVTRSKLRGAGFINDDGETLHDDLNAAAEELTAAVLEKMNAMNPNSGFLIEIRFDDLATVRASEFAEFAAPLR